MSVHRTRGRAPLLVIVAGVVACVWLAPTLVLAQGQEKALGAAIDLLLEAFLFGVVGFIQLILMVAASPKRKGVTVFCLGVGATLAIAGGTTAAIVGPGWGGVEGLPFLFAIGACLFGISGTVVAARRLRARPG